MENCIWKVAPEERLCEYCCYLGFCDAHPDPEAQHKEKISVYIQAMNRILGVDILEKTRKSQYVWGRNLVAYQLVLDGLSPKEIGVALGIDRSTIYWCLRSARLVFACRGLYAAEARLWAQFQTLVKELLK